MAHTWFVGDTHFGHANIITHAKRPFTSAGEMDEVLIQNWNQVVGRNDDVYDVGDFVFRAIRPVIYYTGRLNGHHHLIWGNHDHDAKRVPQLFASTQEVKYLKLHGEQITLYHYPLRVWHNSHRGAWALYGHCHGSLPNFHRSMDVGVDCHGYTPVHFDTIKTYMDQQPVSQHHPELLTDPLGEG